jgi:hypothetical protein
MPTFACGTLVEKEQSCPKVTEEMLMAERKSSSFFMEYGLVLNYTNRRG